MKRFLPLACFLSALAACDLKSPTDPSNPSNDVVYNPIGASDAIGYGSSGACVPFTSCSNGKGYVQLIEQRLKAEGKSVTMSSNAVPGGVLSREIQDIGNSIGRDILTNFIENQMPWVRTDSTVVTVFAGGNDANAIGAAVEAGLGGSDPAGYISTRIIAFGRDLKTLVDGIKARAPNARIVFINLPNLAGLPYASGYSLPKKQVLQAIAVGFSGQVNAMTGQGAAVVDVMCDGSFYQSNMYFSDGFHPNDLGYARLADVTYPAVKGQSTTPRSSCPEMSKF